MVIEVRGKSFFVSDLPERLPFWEGVRRGSWEPETFGIFEKYLRPDRSYLDVGAWIGPTALYGCQLAKMCYAFDPDPVAFKELYDNRELNPDFKIAIYNAAIGASESPMTTLGAHSHFGDSMSSLVKKNASITVNQISLTEAIRLKADLNFIKMDIEGGEALVLPAAKAILQERAPTLYLSLHAPFWPGGTEDYFQKIIDVISVYKHVYFEGEEILPAKIRILPMFDSILCTND